MAEKNWRAEAHADAKSAVLEFIDGIVKGYIDDEGRAQPTSIYDYSDRYHFENHVDKDYSLLEASNILDQLSEFEEDDSGLWEGRPPRDAVKVQAAYTYGNAVASLFKDLMGELNDAVDEIVGNELFFDLKTWYWAKEGSLPPGAFQWEPPQEPFEELDEKAMAKLEREHTAHVENRIDNAVQRALAKW